MCACLYLRSLCISRSGHIYILYSRSRNRTHASPLFFFRLLASLFKYFACLEIYVGVATIAGGKPHLFVLKVLLLLNLWAMGRVALCGSVVLFLFLMIMSQGECSHLHNYGGYRDKEAHLLIDCLFQARKERETLLEFL